MSNAPESIAKFVPDQSKTVKALVDRYNSLAKASNENVLALAETIFIAERELNQRYLEDFYSEVNLDPKSATVRKLCVIGAKMERFEPHLDILPNAWTTLYALAHMKDEEFEKVVASGVLSPFASLKVIEEVVRGPREQHASPFRVTVDLSKLGETTKQKELAKKLLKLLHAYHLELETTPDHREDLEHILHDEPIASSGKRAA